MRSSLIYMYILLFTPILQELVCDKNYLRQEGSRKLCINFCQVNKSCLIVTYGTVQICCVMLKFKLWPLLKMYLLNSLVHAVFEKYFSSEISLLLRKSYWICGCLNPGFIFWKAPVIKTKSSNIAWKYPKFLSGKLYKPYFTSTHLYDILNWLF